MSAPLSIRRGCSRARDPLQAAQELFVALDQPDNRLTVFYCSPDYPLAALAQALHKRFGNINLIGCTTAGEITPLGYLSGSLTGFSLASPTLEVATQLIALEDFNAVATGTGVEAMTRRMGARHGVAPTADDTFAMLLIDGLARCEERVVSCVHQSLHGIELVGGSAADGVRFTSTQLYYRGRFHTGIALLTLVRSGQPFLAFRTQNIVKTGQRMVVTRADPANRIVHEINGCEAVSEYARLVGSPPGGLNSLVFAAHPLVVRVGGQYFVRSIATANADGSLTFFCAIDAGIVLTIARGLDMVQNLSAAFAKVCETLGKPQLVLGWDCVLRSLEAERTGTRDAIGKLFVDNNVIGFASYGEQFNAMHVNQTFAGIAIGRCA
jgi:hypothetical protein